LLSPLISTKHKSHHLAHTSPHPTSTFPMDSHPLDHAIPMSLRQKIKDLIKLTSDNLDAPISSLNDTLLTEINRQSFFNLILHGSPIDDSIIFSYLCFFSDTHPNIKFVDSNFHCEFA